MCSKLKEKMIKNMFVVSKKPVLLRDLLEANATFNEGMLVDPSKPNFKFLYGRSYIIFAIICIAILIPLIAISHHIFEKINFHFSIIAAVIFTSAVFICFDIFKAWARRELTRELIKKAWANHFPYFAYEKYSETVEKIYDEALKNDIPKRDLEQYVLGKLVNA